MFRSLLVAQSTKHPAFPRLHWPTNPAQSANCRVQTRQRLGFKFKDILDLNLYIAAILVLLYVDCAWSQHLFPNLDNDLQ